ncbi:MAG: sugar transferase, partial [Candidatus Omnitrophota bacterium]|nr:sugar transferase [Candidatus Omnitrophota bacterium]
MIFFDLCVVTAAFFLAHSMRFTGIQTFNFGYFMLFLPVVLLIWGGLLYFFGMYASFRVRPLPDIIFTIVKTAVFGFIIFGSFLYALKIQDISRSFIILAFVFAAILLIIEKTGLLL